MLPSREAAVHPRRRFERSPGTSPALQPTQAQHEILVVDDEPRLRDLARCTLADHGYCVTTAASGHEALALVAARPFALVISDYAMPDGDGLTLLAAMRRLRPELPFILWSAALPSEARRQACDLGAENCHAKVTGDDLSKLVDDVLAQRRRKQRNTNLRLASPPFAGR